MVLSFILVQNRQGKTRLAKWYAPYTDEEKVKLKGEVRDATLARLPIYPVLTANETSPGPPPDRPARPKIPVQLRRVPLCAQQLRLDLSPRPTARAPESVLDQDRLPAVRGPVLLRLRRRQRQRARVPRGHSLLRRGPRPVLRQRLRVGPRVQLLQGLRDPRRGLFGRRD